MACVSGDYSPKRLGERLLDVCIAVALGAAALYGAVWLLQQVWPWLVGIGLVLGAGWAVWSWRQRRW